MMAYHLEQIDQVRILRPLLKKITDEPTDIFIITADGDTIETHKLLFCLYSKIFSRLLGDFNTSEVAAVTIPMPTILVRNIIRILQEGKAYDNKKDALIEVSFCGSVLGIDFQGMQMGSRKQKHAVKFTGGNVDEEHKENDKYFPRTKSKGKLRKPSY